MNFEFSIIGLSETWINETNISNYKLSGYNHVHSYRKSKSGGGVSLHIKESINYTNRDDLSIFNEHIESIFIEIDKCYTGFDRNVIVCCIYRPPNTDINMFIEHVRQIMSNIKPENKYVYVMGDFNLNLLNVDKHKLTADFIEFMYSFLFLPLINKPTRIKSNTATLIDNIFCNDLESTSMFNGILYTDISDHLPVFCVNYHTETKVKNMNSVMKRQYNTSNIEKFKSKLEQIDWNAVMNTNNYQEAFSLFHDLYINCYQNSFPLKTQNIYKNRKPWLTSGLKKSIKIKNQLYVKASKVPNSENINKNKLYRNKLHSLLRKSERNHYDLLFTLNKNNLTKSWSIIKDVLNRKRNRSLPDKITVNNKTVSDKGAIANQFNQYFTNIGSNLA